MAKITFEVLEEGTIKWDIEGSIAGPDHVQAELFMKRIAQLAGGEVEIEEKGGHHHHDLEVEGGDIEHEHHHG